MGGRGNRRRDGDRQDGEPTTRIPRSGEPRPHDPDDDYRPRFPPDPDFERSGRDRPRVPAYLPVATAVLLLGLVGLTSWNATLHARLDDMSQQLSTLERQREQSDARQLSELRERQDESERATTTLRRNVNARIDTLTDPSERASFPAQLRRATSRQRLAEACMAELHDIIINLEIQTTVTAIPFIDAGDGPSRQCRPILAPELAAVGDAPDPGAAGEATTPPAEPAITVPVDPPQEETPAAPAE